MGSVYDRNEGTERPANWWLQYYLTRELADLHNEGDLRWREGTGTRSKVVAQRLLAQREKQITDNCWRPWNAGDDLSFGIVAERAIACGRANKVKTVDNIDQRLRHYVLEELGPRKLTSVSKQDVRAVIRRLVDGDVLRRDQSGPLSPRSVHHVYDAIQFVYRYALDQEPPLVEKSPCTLSTKKKGELPLKRDKDPRWRKNARWLRHEIEILVAAPRELVPLDRLVFYAVELLAGCRCQEVAALQVQDYDRSARPLPRLDVVEQPDGEALKGDGPPREIPVHPVLWALLEEWLTIGWPVLFGREPRSTDLLIPSREGKPRSKRHMLRKLGEDLKRLGLPRRTQHDARRTLATLMQEDGADARFVKAITHEGMATETAGVFRGYSVWGWAALCDAMLMLVIMPGGGGARRAAEAHAVALEASPAMTALGPMRARALLAPSGGSHTSGHTSEPLLANYLEIVQETGRGGRDLKPIPAAESQHNKRKPSSIAADGRNETAKETQGNSQGATPAVAAIFQPTLAEDLRHAADLLRSGRTHHLTADWRERLAAACEQAAVVMAPGTRAPKDFVR